MVWKKCSMVGKCAKWFEQNISILLDYWIEGWGFIIQPYKVGKVDDNDDKFGLFMSKIVVIELDNKKMNSEILLLICVCISAYLLFLFVIISVSRYFWKLLYARVVNSSVQLLKIICWNF